MDKIIFLAALFIIAGIFWWLGRRVCRACEAANLTDWGSVWLNRLDGLNRLFCTRYHRLIYDPIALPEQGAALLVANHISGLDPLLMAAATRRPLRFMIAREEYQRFGLTWLFRAMGCIPVERERRPEQALREALRVLNKGEVVALFPQGGLHLETAPAPKLKRGVFKLAELTGSAIYPVRVEGVTGHGHVVRAVLLRSRARMINFAPLATASIDQHEHLTRLLNGNRD
ncbi:MAG: lysophospholipid acyltransferase family protein [Gammaproteobacteria bacterium]